MNNIKFNKCPQIVLSGALFGIIAASSFQGVNYIVDQSAEKTSTIENTKIVNTSSTSTSGVSEIATNCMPSIVAITNVSVSEVQNYFSMYGGNSRSNPFTQQETTSAGSGVIINKTSDEIDILTNYHVIESAKTLTVTLVDDTSVEASVKGTDEDDDLAVISIKVSLLTNDTLSKIAIATVGSSDNSVVGEQVVAIGNALGYGQSVTSGIISATNRSISTDSYTTNDSNSTKTYIQTDAAINPGNSGGALLNMKGELIGINSAKLSDTDVEGMGYAIPISRVSDEIKTMLQGNSINLSSSNNSSKDSSSSNQNNSNDNLNGANILDYFAMFGL